MIGRHTLSPGSPVMDGKLRETGGAMTVCSMVAKPSLVVNPKGVLWPPIPDGALETAIGTGLSEIVTTVLVPDGPSKSKHTSKSVAPLFNVAGELLVASVQL